MPAHGTPARKSKGSRRLRWPALLSVLVLSSPPRRPRRRPRSRARPRRWAQRRCCGPAPPMARPRPRAGEILKEIGKQAIDQPAHFLIAAAPIWLSRHLVGVPWFGWAAAPLLAYREWLQWPSKRWWDPPLDWAFLIIGVVVATWSRGLARIVLSLPQSIRQARRSRGRGAAMRHDVRPSAGAAGRCFGRALPQCSSRTRMPPITRAMPTPRSGWGARGTGRSRRRR